MAFAIAFVPKTFTPLPSFKTYLPPRKRTIICAAPPRPKGSSGKGGKINRDPATSLNSTQSVKDKLERKTQEKELDGSAKKPKASN